MTFFDQEVASRYDDPSGPMFQPEAIEPAVDVLSEFAGQGRALEFAIGTGRIALPLSERGIDVSGIDNSQPMIDQMLAKAGSDNISVTVGDMASSSVAGEFSVVYLVFNTIGNLITQDQQVACFQNAAAHLGDGGRFVIETFIPELRRMPPGENMIAFDASTNHAGIDEYRFVDQTLISHHYWIRDGVSERFDVEQRYASPAEFDLMARLAGLTLEQRWSNWKRDPFTGESESHISVWQKT